MSLSKGLLAIAVDLIGPIPDFRYRDTVQLVRVGETYVVPQAGITDRNLRRQKAKEEKND